MEESTLFIRQQMESYEMDDDDNPWDDRQLIKAYDRAMTKAKQKILKKIQGELGATNEDMQELFSEASSGTKRKKKKNKNKKKTNTPKAKEWKIGDACRAIFFEDGEEYEAEIIALINPEWCTIRFVGYDNEEDIMLQELRPSLGKQMIMLQQESAAMYKHLEEDDLDIKDQDTSVDPQNDETFPDEAEVKPDISNPRIHLPQRNPLFGSTPPPPPPPPPEAFSTPFNRHMNGGAPKCMTEDETLNAMLLSWYMCGYYTGYYRGRMKTSENRHYH